MNKMEYEELIAFHPGYYVKEYIDEQGMTQAELAKRLQTTPKYISDLVNGRINLTDEMVLRLSAAFGTSTAMWLNLNKKYIEKKLAIQKRIQMDEEWAIARQMDYSYWMELGLVKKTEDAEERVMELQRYFRVSSLNILRQRDFLVQYKTGEREITEVNITAENAWLQTAINMGFAMETEIYDRKKLSAAVPEIRKLILKTPEEYYPKLQKLLAGCGVVLVLLPALQGSSVQGAVKWFGRDKAVLAMVDSRNNAELFWSVLFHELGHVLQQRIKVLIVSGRNRTELNTSSLILRLEKEAENFSRDALIPREEYQKFTEENRDEFTTEVISAFADRIHILPGMVACRLQQDGYLQI